MKDNNTYRHVTFKFSLCDSILQNDKDLISLYSKEAVKLLNIGKLKNSYFCLNPIGITLVMILDNSKLTLVSNIEDSSITLDIFTLSSEINFYPAFSYLKRTFKAIDAELNESLSTNSSDLIKYSFPRDNDNIKLQLYPTVITILGSSGGVAKAVLSILNKAAVDKNDYIYKFISSCKLLLIDLKQKDMNYYKSNFPNLKNKISLYEFDLKDYTQFTNHLKNTKTSIVIDLSLVDTVNLLRCCDSLGVIYINTAFEVLSVDEDESLAGFTSEERFKIFESHRDDFKNTSAIICSGMNPGVVQWMAIHLMKQNKDKHPKACYIVEDDTSFWEDKSLADNNTIYTTWCPVCFLDEAIYCYPTFMKNHLPIFLYKEVYEIEFKVNLGKKEFYGCLMPHEEAITLGKIYDMEIGFLYKVNDYTTNLISKNINNLDVLWDKPMKLLDPEVAPLIGDDLVGILLVYDDKEVYMYNSLNNKKTYEKYKVSATYLQVASGVYGALSTILLDSIPQGIYYVDELLLNTNSNYGKYLSYHLKEFETGENPVSSGTLLDRIRERKY